MRNELLSKKESALADLENSQPILSKGPYTKEVRCVTHESNQPSQQKSEIELEFVRKDLWKTLLFDGLGPQIYIKGQGGF